MVTMLKTDFKFGEKILVTAVITRARGKPRKFEDEFDIPNSDELVKWMNYRYWYRTPLVSPLVAVFLGGRMLSNGDSEFDPEDGNIFYHREYIKGAWICFEGSNPQKVFLEDCKKRETRRSKQTREVASLPHEVIQGGGSEHIPVKKE